MTGGEVIARLRDETLADGVPILILSGYRMTSQEVKDLGADGAVAVALVVQGELDADAPGPVAAVPGTAVDAEGTDLAAREEHEVVGLRLQLIGAGELGGELDRGGLVDHELRADVERGVG